MTTLCAGCLDTRECWVCLGTGAQDTDHGIGLCGSCRGQRLCRYCTPQTASAGGEARG